MTITLAIEIAIPGAPPVPGTLELPAGPVSVGDVVRARAGAEWDARRDVGPEVAPPAPGDAPAPTSREAALRVALDAFRAGWFVVLVDGEPAMALDERVDVTPRTRLRFARLYLGSRA